MKVGSWVAVFAIAMIGSVGCQLKPAGEAMSGADVHAAFAGNTLHASSVDGDLEIYVAQPDDTVHGMLWGGRHDFGTSTVSADGNFCITWHQTFDGKTSCHTVRRSAAGFDLVDADGIVFATVKTSTGNSDGLQPKQALSCAPAFAVSGRCVPSLMHLVGGVAIRRRITMNAAERDLLLAMNGEASPGLHRDCDHGCLGSFRDRAGILACPRTDTAGPAAIFLEGTSFDVSSSIGVPAQLRTTRCAGEILVPLDPITSAAA